MKWKSDWHGISIVSENKGDDEILKELLAKLPSKAFESYEDGMMEQSVHLDGSLKIQFWR